MQIQLFVGLFLAVIIALFALQNTEPVTVRFLVFAFEGVALPLIILITAALAAGATILLGVSGGLRNRARTGELRRVLAERDAQLASSRADPPAAPPASPGS